MDDTVDFPVAIEPVRPRSSILVYWSSIVVRLGGGKELAIEKVVLLNIGMTRSLRWAVLIAGCRANFRISRVNCLEPRYATVLLQDKAWASVVPWHIELQSSKKYIDSKCKQTSKLEPRVNLNITFLLGVHSHLASMFRLANPFSSLIASNLPKAFQRRQHGFPSWLGIGLKNCKKE